MSLRAILERLGVIEDETDLMAEQQHVRMEAEAVNENARSEIHASRNRRQVLQLRLEQIQRQQHR